MRTQFLARRLMIASILGAMLGTSSFAYGEDAGQFVDDATITAKVKAAMMTDTSLKAIPVHVETDQGVVKLTGSVATKAQESEAIRVTNTVEGVKSVKDLLKVRGSQED